MIEAVTVRSAGPVPVPVDDVLENEVRALLGVRSSESCVQLELSEQTARWGTR